MKFEVEKKSNKKKIIIGASILIVIGIFLVVRSSYAKYSSIKTIHIVNGTVNYTAGDFSIVAMYKNDGSGDTEITTMPNEGYTINQDKSYCTLNGTKDDNVKLSTDIDGNHEFKGLSKGSKCYLYFDKIAISNATLAKLKLTSKGKYNEIDAFTGIATAIDIGIYETVDDDGKSYYFRGVEGALNNWVEFAGFYWRIIRINGNGSIRMIYSGVANGLPSNANKTGTTTQINNTTYKYNHTYNDNAYVGYMMGIPLNGTGTSSNITTNNSTSYEGAHTNAYDSDIKKNIDTWYEKNINNKTSSAGKSYTTYLDSEVGFCNDREINNAASNYSGNGAGTSATSYAPAGKLLLNGSWKSTQTPTLKCTNKERDLFTVSEAKIGNKKLTYPVGLITSDEVVYAGGFGGTNNTTYYLYTKEYYWTMSPYGMTSDHSAYMFRVGSSGYLDRDYISNSYGIRPVINIRSDVTITGAGSEIDPFIVS